MILLFLNIQPASSKNNNLYLDFFYLEGCSGCEKVEPTIETVDLLYPELTVLNFNMDLTPRPMPLAVIISGADYTYINYFNFTKENVDNAVDNYLESKNDKIIIEYLYRDETYEYNRTKKIIEDVASNNSERISIKEYRLETNIPLVIIRDSNYDNYKKFEYGTISRDNFIDTIEKFNTAQQKTENKENNFILSNLEIIIVIALILIIILIFILFFRKKYKKR